MRARIRSASCLWTGRSALGLDRQPPHLPELVQVFGRDELVPVRAVGAGLELGQQHAPRVEPVQGGRDGVLAAGRRAVQDDAVRAHVRIRLSASRVWSARLIAAPSRLSTVTWAVGGL